MGQFVTVERGENAIATIRLSRPPMNALDTTVQTELADAAREVSADGGIRAVVIFGGEKVFAAGADIKEFGEMDHAAMARDAARVQEAFAAVARIPKPVIAAVTGYALGGGCELALCCDLIVADETALFGLPETTVGLVPGGGGTQLTQRRLGPGRAADLIFTGRRVAADEAERIGLIDRLAPAGKASAQALELAQQIAANSPVAVRAAKQAIRHGAGIGLTAALDVEDAAWRKAAMSPDRREGIAAFNEKRSPNWPGR
jgi:enoyl-CoA hydratase/carnithine racemase